MVNWSPSLQTAVSDLVCCNGSNMGILELLLSLYVIGFMVLILALSFLDSCLGSGVFRRTWYSLLCQISGCWRFKVSTFGCSCFSSISIPVNTSLLWLFILSFSLPCWYFIFISYNQVCCLNMAGPGIISYIAQRKKKKKKEERNGIGSQ